MTMIYEIIDFFYDIYFFLEKFLRDTYTAKIISGTWIFVKDLWYFGLLGAFAAVIIAQFLSRKNVRAFLMRKGSIPILFAAVIGVISPMSTFAAIPLVGGLMVVGVPIAPLMAFLVASPLMNPSLFIITWGVIGPEMALVRTLSALFLGVLSGIFIQFMQIRGWMNISKPLRENFAQSGGVTVSILDMENATVVEKLKVFLHELWIMLIFISKYFFLALFIAGTVQAIVEPRWIAALFGGKGFSSVLLAGLLGVPLYVCGGGTVATIAVLVSKGMGQGAALAFFITGPATKISTILSLNAVLKKKIAAVYLVVTLAGGVLLGYGYSFIAPELPIDQADYGRVESTEDAILYKPGIGSGSSLLY